MQKGVVIPSKPEENRLVQLVETGEMPMGGDPLSAEQI